VLLFCFLIYEEAYFDAEAGQIITASDGLARLVSGSQELSCDIFTLQKEVDYKDWKNRDLVHAKCKYHEHGANEPCPLKSKQV
jgi:hypothetical protein